MTDLLVPFAELSIYIPLYTLASVKSVMGDPSLKKKVVLCTAVTALTHPSAPFHTYPPMRL